MRESTYWLWYLAFLFFAIETVVCFERATQSKPLYKKAGWSFCGMLGVVGFLASLAYSRNAI